VHWPPLAREASKLFEFWRNVEHYLINNEQCVVLWSDESFVERGIMQTMKHPDGDWKCETWPVRFDGKPPELKPAPKLGQHTDEVMASWLKMSPSDVAKLKSEKIIGNS
jgi:crotonobetainyl-CoA:carnitine CoA-transferase CaiB-like acyl-CoA transferase